MLLYLEIIHIVSIAGTGMATLMSSYKAVAGRAVGYPNTISCNGSSDTFSSVPSVCHTTWQFVSSSNLTNVFRVLINGWEHRCNRHSYLYKEKLKIQLSSNTEALFSKRQILVY